MRKSSYLTTLAVFIAIHSSFFFTSPFTDAWENSWTNSFQNEKRKHEGEDVLEALLSEGEEKCNGKRCVQSDQCCPGSVCVDVDGMAGTCLPIYGVSEGERCDTDKDCETGLHCTNNPSRAAVQEMTKTCQPMALNMRKKQCNNECLSSQECDGNRGLCCQLMRRHRQTPRKLCYYFSDPKSCIGPVDITHIKPMSHGISAPFFKARLG